MTAVAPGLVVDVGTLQYTKAWELQQRLVLARQRGAIPDVLLLLQHPHTYTLGRRTKPEHLLLNQELRNQRGIASYWVDRGGDITYHGPGQLVGYPILDLRGRGRDVHSYLYSLEEALIQTLAGRGIVAVRDQINTGVWVDRKKIAAIGVKISRGVTSHGFAINVNTDLSYFQGIIPCGIADRTVTSIAQELGAAQDFAAIQQVVTEGFAAEFGGQWEPNTLENLLARVPDDIDISDRSGYPQAVVAPKAAILA